MFSCKKFALYSIITGFLTLNPAYGLEREVNRHDHIIDKKDVSDICRPAYSLEEALQKKDLIIQDCRYVIDISLEQHRLSFYEYGSLVKEGIIAAPKKRGDKIKSEDGRIKYGVFRLYQFEKREPDLFGYGFIRIDFSDLGFYGFGLHGTEKEWLLGKDVSKGCIRARNDLIKTIVERTKGSIDEVLIIIKP